MEPFYTAEFDVPLLEADTWSSRSVRIKGHSEYYYGCSGCGARRRRGIGYQPADRGGSRRRSRSKAPSVPDSLQSSASRSQATWTNSRHPAPVDTR